MIQLLTKKRFRFKNPHASMIKSEVVGTGEDQKTIQTQDGGAKFEEAYFEVPPDKLTACPDWVKTDKIFEWGVKDGDIIEVLTKSEMQADAARQQSEGARADEAAKNAEAAAKAKENLSKMTKVELLKYASDTHELELSPSMNKENILAAIAQAEKDAADEGN